MSGTFRLKSSGVGYNDAPSFGNFYSGMKLNQSNSKSNGQSQRPSSAGATRKSGGNSGYSSNNIPTINLIKENNDSRQSGANGVNKQGSSDGKQRIIWTPNGIQNMKPSAQQYETINNIAPSPGYARPKSAGIGRSKSQGITGKITSNDNGSQDGNNNPQGYTARVYSGIPSKDRPVPTPVLNRPQNNEGSTSAAPNSSRSAGPQVGASSSRGHSSSNPAPAGGEDHWNTSYRLHYGLSAAVNGTGNVDSEKYRMDQQQQHQHQQQKTSSQGNYPPVVMPPSRPVSASSRIRAAINLGHQYENSGNIQISTKNETPQVVSAAAQAPLLSTGPNQASGQSAPVHSTSRPLPSPTVVYQLPSTGVSHSHSSNTMNTHQRPDSANNINKYATGSNVYHHQQQQQQQQQQLPTAAKVEVQRLNSHNAINSTAINTNSESKLNGNSDSVGFSGTLGGTYMARDMRLDADGGLCTDGDNLGELTGMDGKIYHDNSHSRTHPEVSTTSASLELGDGSHLFVHNSELRHGSSIDDEDLPKLTTLPNQFCTSKESIELRKILQMSQALLMNNNINNTNGQVIGTAQIGDAATALMDMYMVGKIVGVGSYGKVRAAWHRLTGSKVAIKTYDKAKLKDPEHWKRVQSEIKIMETISHPRIVRMFESVETPKRVHLIIECLEGGNLCSYVKSKRSLSEAESKKIFFQLATALDHLHQFNIIHRDIKLENVLFDSNGDIKLIDFGFSTVSPNGKKLKVFCGTPSYMAPEIVKRTEYEGKPVDMWGLGILLFALLNGCFPFRAKSYPDLYRRIARGTFLIPDELSSNVRDLIRQLLNVDAYARISAASVLQHPWLESQLATAPDLNKIRNQTSILISEKPVDDINDKVLNDLERYGLSKDDLVRQIMSKTHCSLSTFYYLMLDVTLSKGKNPQNQNRSSHGVISNSSHHHLQAAKQSQQQYTAAGQGHPPPSGAQGHGYNDKSSLEDDEESPQVINGVNMVGNHASNGAAANAASSGGGGNTGMQRPRSASAGRQQSSGSSRPKSASATRRANGYPY